MPVGEVKSPLNCPVDRMLCLLKMLLLFLSARRSVLQGVDPSIRIEVWKFLLKYYSWDSSYQIRTEQRKKKVYVSTNVVTIPDFAMRYVSRYLGHDAIRIAILVYRVSQSLDLQFVYDASATYRPRYTLPNHQNRCSMCWSLAVA